MSADLLTWRRTLIGSVALVAPVAFVAVRSHRDLIMLTIAASLIRPAAKVGDAVEGDPRQRAGLKLTAGLFLAMLLYYPAPPGITWWLAPWLLVPLYLAVYSTRTIGASVNAARRTETAKAILDKLCTFDGAKGPLGVMRARQLLKLIAEDFTTGDRKMLEAPDVSFNGRDFDEQTSTLTIWFRCKAALNVQGTNRAVALGLGGLSTEKLRLRDLHQEGAGLYRIDFTLERPFAFVGAGKMPKPLPQAQVPPNHYEAGVDLTGRPVFMPLNHNIFIGGATRSGKTQAEKLIAQASIAARDAEGRPNRWLVIIDLKKVGFVAFRNIAKEYADTPERGIEVLRWLRGIVDERLDHMKLHGIEVWTEGMGPYIDVIIDECHDLFTHDKLAKEAASIGSDITAQCSAAGVFMRWATQHPTAESLPRRIKVNCPALIGFRVLDGNAARAVAGEDAQQRGFDLARDELPQGRAVVRDPDVGRRWMHGHLPADMPRVQTEADAPPLPPPTFAPPQPSSVRPSAPPWAPPTQGEQPRTDGRTNNPTDATLKGLEAKLWPELNGHPRTNKELADVIGASTSGTHDALKRLRDKGLAVFAGDGWQRAD